MRDIFEDIFADQPLDPMEAARRNMRSNLRTRFYKDATTREGDGGFALLLDGRAVLTPARKPLAAPVRLIAEAMAAEWNAQGKVVDPVAMPLTRLVNAIIDGVASAPAAVADEIAKYLGTDLLLYRAPDPEGLVALQRKHWDPVLVWARDELGARFVLAEGVMHVTQAPEALAAARPKISGTGGAAGPWRLGALNLVTAITGSALLALALAERRLSPDEVWTAAHVDEDWNMQLWGRDELALQRREHRRKEFEAAALILATLTAQY